MKKDLLKKLKTYSKTVAAMTIAGNTANAQIVYTDVNPDVTLNSFPSYYDIDFNADDSIDFNFEMISYNNYVAGMIARATNTSTPNYVSFVGSSSYAYVLNQSDIISQALNFYDIGLLAFGYSSEPTPYGYWADNINDKYLGVKFKISGQLHYGWVRLSTTYNAWNDMSLTIKSFAYQAIPDSAINAGMINSVEQINKELDLKLYPNPAKDYLKISLKQRGDYTIKIIDISGKEIISDLFTDKEKIINISNLSAGSYIFILSNKNIKIVKKFNKIN